MIRIILSFLTGVQILFLLACATAPTNTKLCVPNSNEVVSKGLASIENHEWHHVLIRTDSLYYKHFDYAYSNDTSWLILINELKKSLEIYNLNSARRIFSKCLEEFGINYPKNGFVNGIEFLDFDSIFIASESKVWLIDTQSVTYSFDLPYVKQFGQTLKLYNLDHSPIRFDACSGQLLFQCYATSLPSSSLKFYSMPITAGIGTKDHEIIFYTLTYPELYKNNYFGFANMVFRSVSGCKSFYSFPADRQIYQLDHTTNQINSFCAISSFDNGTNRTLKRSDKDQTELKLNAMIQMPFYMSLLPDDFRHQYYRFFLAPLTEKKSTGEFNAWLDKELILMVLDENFNGVAEYSLGINKYSYFRCFVGQEGLYLSLHHDTTQNAIQYSLNFDIFK